MLKWFICYGIIPLVVSCGPFATAQSFQEITPDIPIPLGFSSTNFARSITPWNIFSRHVIGLRGFAIIVTVPQACPGLSVFHDCYIHKSQLSNDLCRKDAGNLAPLRNPNVL